MTRLLPSGHDRLSLPAANGDDNNDALTILVPRPSDNHIVVDGGDPSEENEEPMSSNIEHTKGGPASDEEGTMVDHGHTDEGIQETNGNTLGGPDTLSMPKPSASFDSEDPGDWGSDSPDEMDMYAFNVVGGLKASKEAPPKMDPNQDLTRHIYSTADGPDCPIRPLTTPVERRAWICDHCKALNSLVSLLHCISPVNYP